MPGAPSPSTSPAATALAQACRQKYALATIRLQRGEDALALLSVHGALEDGLRAYLAGKGVEPEEGWRSLLDALQEDQARPVSDEDAERLRRTNALRNRLAHGEDVRFDRSMVAGYHQFAGRLLRGYGYSLERAPDPLRAQRQGDFTGGRPAAPAREGGSLDRYRHLLAPAAALVVVLVMGWLAASSLLNGPQPLRQAVATNVLPTAVVPTSASLPPVPPPTPANALPAAPYPAADDAMGVPAATPQAGLLAVGSRATVRADAEGLNVRSDPGSAGAVVTTLASGAEVAVLEGPRQLDGRAWWRVRAGTAEGWCAGEFLVTQAAP